MSDEGDVISLSDAESEGAGPTIRPPQAKGEGREGRGSSSKRRHGDRKRKHEDREDRRRQRRERESEGDKREHREHRRVREERGVGREGRRDREREGGGRSRGGGRGEDPGQDLRVRLNRRDSSSRHVVERREDRREDRAPRDQDTDRRLNRFLGANRHMEDSRRDVDARKKRKLIEKEMEKLQAKIGRRVEAGRSREGSRERARRKSESGEESGEDDSEEAASGEAESGEGDSEEESETDGAASDATTGSQKSEDTPDREAAEREDTDGEVVDDDIDLEEQFQKSKSKSRSKSPEESTKTKSRWADKSPSAERTPSRSPTPMRELREDSPDPEDTPPGSGEDSPPLQHALHPRSAPGSPGTPQRPVSAQQKPPSEPISSRFGLLPPYLPSVHGCRSVAEFTCKNRIEEGTYGVVYRAEDKRTKEIVALKKLKMEREKEGFPITSLREINTLLIAQHVNVVTVREIVVGSNMDQIFIVMDFVQHDLKGLMETMRKKNQVFLPGEVKCLMQQLLRAIHHLHDNWILHRDLKASNILLSHNGILKVGDFGLAREYGSPLKNYTAIVVTLWYRAPELLLGVKQYSTHIDVWSIGCILGELLLMEPLFPGKSEVDELNKIFKLLGTPSEKIWPGYKDLPGVRSMKFVDFPVSKLREKFPERMLTAGGLELMKGLLTYDPKQRMTCEKALQHRWFEELPRPIDPSMFPTWPAKSEMDPGARKVASPKPPSGGGAFKNIDDDEARVNRSRGFNLADAVKNNPPTAGWNLKF